MVYVGFNAEVGKHVSKTGQHYRELDIARARAGASWQSSGQGPILPLSEYSQNKAFQFDCFCF